MAIQHISYERFFENIRYSSNKNTRIKYKSKEYEFWYEKGKYCFRQCLPEIKEKQTFLQYEEMLNSIRIEGNSIKDLWNLDELEYFYKSPAKSIRGADYSTQHARMREIIQPYLKNKKLYTTTMAYAQKINIGRGISDIMINKECFMQLWYFYIEKVFGCSIILFGMTSSFPVDGISISDSFFYQHRLFLFIAHLLSLLSIGFFVPLLNDAPDKIKGYLKSNCALNVFILLSILGVSINSCFSISIAAGILTFVTFILCDFVSLCVGYFAYKIYYNRKLKEAERIREEYRREHSEENVG